MVDGANVLLSIKQNLFQPKRYNSAFVEISIENTT